ncbi:MAG: YidC/Oxa1 family membrane protein insertase [Chloroflexota bacterium]
MLDIIIVPFINILLWIYQTLGNNFGWAIIIFTVVIRLATYPFTKQQMDGAAKMQEMQNSPEWKKVEKKYKNDKNKIREEQAKLMQEMNVNPFSSCLPTLLQFPIIIGLYWSVTRTMAATPIQLVELSKNLNLPNASSLIPLNPTFLWIADLSQPERLFLDFLPTFGIPVLAILVFISSYLSSKMMAPANTNPNDPGAQMSKSMTITMPLLMAWLSYSYSAGLALYFATSNIASIAQYALMGKLNLEVFGIKSKK